MPERLRSREENRSSHLVTYHKEWQFPLTKIEANSNSSPGELVHKPIGPVDWPGHLEAAAAHVRLARRESSVRLLQLLRCIVEPAYHIFARCLYRSSYEGLQLLNDVRILKHTVDVQDRIGVSSILLSTLAEILGQHVV